MSLRKQPTAPRPQLRVTLARPAFSLSSIVLLGLSVWLITAPALAEPAYHVAHKIGPRSRASILGGSVGLPAAPVVKTSPAVPQLDPGPTPALKVEPPAQVDAAPRSTVADLHTQLQPYDTQDATAKPVPVTVSVTRTVNPAASRQSSAKPVSASNGADSVQKVYQPETQIGADQQAAIITALHASDKAVKQNGAVNRATQPVLPEVPVLQEAKGLPQGTARTQALGQTTNGKTAPEDKPAKNKHEKKPHPVVIAPEPLLPAPEATEASQPKANDGMWDIANPSGQSDQQSAAGTTSARKSAKTSSAITAIHPMSSSKMSSSKPSTTRRSAYGTSASHHATAAHVMEPGFYPVGFSPAIRPIAPAKVQSMGKALSHYNRGVYYTERHQWDNAVSEYNQVLTQHLNMADAYVGLSTAALHKRDWEGAMKNSLKALRLKDGFLDPANITQARYNLSSVYCITDDYRKSLSYFKLVKKANHPESEALWGFIQNNCNPSGTIKQLK